MYVNVCFIALDLAGHRAVLVNIIMPREVAVWPVSRGAVRSGTLYLMSFVALVLPETSK